MPAKEHMSRQFSYVIHGSEEETPVHLIPDSNYKTLDRKWVNKEVTNLHPSAFHAGSVQAVVDRGSSFKHLYRINKDNVDPLVWGDTGFGDPQYPSQSFMEEHAPEKPMLTETTSFTHDLIDKNVNSKNPTVTQYRNMAEDAGNISFIIPKNLVGRGVDYLGTVPTNPKKEDK